MKILAIEKELEGANWKNQNEVLEQEAYHVHELYLSGYLREIYFNELHNAVLILECVNIDKAREILNDLPLVKEGLIDFEIMQLNPYTGYDRIIDKQVS